MYDFTELTNSCCESRVTMETKLALQGVVSWNWKQSVFSQIKDSQLKLWPATILPYW